MTSQCKTISEWLKKYADGSLEGPESDRVRRHLAACPSCRSALKAERRLLQDLATLPKQSCPESVADSIMRRVEVHGRAAEIPWWRNIRLRHWNLKPAFAVVLIIALALGLREWKRAPQRRQASYSEAEVKLANAALEWSLALASETIREAEKQALETAFAVPSADATKTPVNSGGNKK